MRRTVLAAILSAGCLTSAAWAQSARDDRPANPRPDGRPGIDRPDGRPGLDRPLRLELDVQMELVKAAYLGVTTTPAPKSLRHQVELPHGVGLVVDSVAPDSPAAAAGLKQHDLLHKIDHQILVNPQQLAVLVRTYKAGESVKLTVIRGGKSVELIAKLVEKDLPPLDDLRLVVEPRIIEDQLRWAPMPQGQGLPFVLPRPDGMGVPGMLMDQNMAIAWDDGTISMSIKVENGKRTLVAKDKDGKELYNGPIDTEEQRSSLPQAVRDRMKNVMVPGMPRGPQNRREGDRRPEGERRPEGDPEPRKPQRPEGN